MGRPFIEFVQCQTLPWREDMERSGRECVKVKILSEDSETGAFTALVRYPPGWAAKDVEWGLVDEEFFVLGGKLGVNDRTYTRHHYAYWPAGFRRRNFSADAEHGALLLVAFAGRASYTSGSGLRPSYDPKALTEQVDCFRLPWDRTNMDPNIAHLNAWRKNLRLAPDGSCRTYLLAGLPQGYPESGGEPLERHPHVEEMFMISGDMPCSLGVMRAGAYFWRPPGIWHGADCTVNGFLLFARTPGTNQTISEWSAEPHPVRFDPAHVPRVPDDLAGAARPIPDPIVY